MLSLELREGKKHCQKGTPAYLIHTLGLAGKRRGAVPVRVWVDAGYNAHETLRFCTTVGSCYC